MNKYVTKLSKEHQQHKQSLHYVTMSFTPSDEINAIYGLILWSQLLLVNCDGIRMSCIHNLCFGK